MDLWVIPFSVVWTVFAVKNVGAAVEKSDSSVAPAMGALFIALGVYMMAARFFVDIWRRRNTAYALTDHRVILARSGPLPSMRSIDLWTMKDVSLTERRDGSGTILFGHPRGPNTVNPWTGNTVVPSFDMIPSAAAVYAMLRDAQARIAQASAESSRV
jgi:hypothetical protein